MLRTHGHPTNVKPKPIKHRSPLRGRIIERVYRKNRATRTSMISCHRKLAQPWCEVSWAQDGERRDTPTAPAQHCNRTLRSLVGQRRCQCYSLACSTPLAKTSANEGKSDPRNLYAHTPYLLCRVMMMPRAARNQAGLWMVIVFVWSLAGCRPSCPPSPPPEACKVTTDPEACHKAFSQTCAATQ